MTLTDPRDALAEQSNFISYLMGLASLGRVARRLADGERRAEPPSDAGEFVHVLLGLASLGASIEGLAESVPAPQRPAATAPSSDSTTTRWLR
jgi:hypothetical protein